MRAEPELTDRLRRYLLGTLPAAEREGLEVELLRDDDLFEQLLALEDEAVHDIAQDGEAAVALAPLAERLRGTAAGRRRLATAALLVEELAGRRAIGSGARRRPTGWLALAAGLLVAVGVTWFVATVRQGERREENQVARPDRSQPPTTSPPLAASAPVPPLAAASPAQSPPTREEQRPLAAPPVVMALALSPGLVRGEEGAPRVELAPEVNALRLTLALPSGAPLDAPYLVALVDAEGVERWRQGAVRTRQVAAAPIVRVDVPAAVLPEGDYELTLAVETALGSEPVADYAFGVLRVP